MPPRTLPPCLPISPVHHVRVSGVRDSRGPAEVGKGRGLNGVLTESVNVAQRGPTGGRRQQQESC